MAFVLLKWALEKFVDPALAAMEYAARSGPGVRSFGGIGQLLRTPTFATGPWRRRFCGAVLALDAVSTVFSRPRYPDLFNCLLFPAAWLMLTAFLDPYLLRNED